jgi:ABC-2 type transport system permease protein
MALSSFVKQLENFAGVMNFVIFPMFFLSSALYPLWKMAESSELLHDICAANPFTHAVELIRFALYVEWNPMALLWTALATLVFMALAVWGYDPARGMMTRKG